jgi:adenylate kinase
MKKIPVVLLIGISGSGKDTQGDLLQEKYRFASIRSGDLLRAKMNALLSLPKDSVEAYEAKWIKTILDEKGKFVPTLTVIAQWHRPLLEIMCQEALSGVIFTGSPRKLSEAMIIHDFFFTWPDAVARFEFSAIELTLSEESAIQRLLKRERHDDNEKAIKNRIAEFHTYVSDSIKFFKEKGALKTINGDQEIEEVHQDIVKAIGLE